MLRMPVESCRLLSRWRRYFSSSSLSRMRLMQFEHEGQKKIGVELSEGGDVVDLTGAEKKFPSNMMSFLSGEFIEDAKRFVAANPKALNRREIVTRSPITGPSKVICVGMNYRDHCKETDTPIPTEPIIFNKLPNTIIGTGENIIIPKLSEAVDWEVELAIVIGKAGKHIKASNALNHVAGYTVALDVSARDWFGPKNGGQWLLGKTFDTFCPLGPVIVTKDEITDPHKLGIRCLVNDKTMQDSNTDQLIFKTEDCIEWISRFCTLEPGDLILTGTPPGVGACRNPPIYLKPGDVVTCEIETIGKICNEVVAET